MAVTPTEAFKLGFLQRCLERGLDPATVNALTTTLEEQPLEKRAEDGSLLSGLMTGAAAGLIGAAGIGAGTGYGLARLQDPGLDPDEVRKQEMIAEYRRLVAQAKNKMRAKVLRGETPV